MTDEQKDELELLNSNITKAARIVAIGKTEEERVAASQLYDELVEKRSRLQAAVEPPKMDKTDVTANPYARIDYLEEKMGEAAASGDMSMYSTMRIEKKQLIHLHGRRAPVVTGTSAAEIRERRRQQQEQDHANRQRLEDERNNPQEKTFEDESDLLRKMTEAAQRGDHIEYGRLRKLRKAG